MTADPLRRQALEILIDVYEGEALDGLLDQALNSLPDPQHKAFLAELVRGTLQWRGRYQYILSRFLKQKTKIKINEQALFHLSLHQLLGLNGVPAYAAIHQAGELCRIYVSDRKVGFVNGVLQAVRRKFLTEDSHPDDPDSEANRLAKMKQAFDRSINDPLTRLAAWQSHPEWLVRRWEEKFGFDAVEKICAFNNEPVNIAFHVLKPSDPAKTIDLLAEAGLEVESGNNPETLLLQDKPSRSALGKVLEQDPSLIVQDPTVQEATSWLMEAAESLRGTDLENHPVLDMCAAPGGKTARLAATMPGTGKVVAMDNRDSRVALLQQTVDRVNLDRIEVKTADGLNAPFEAGSFGAVLLDGPCSGTGVLRHHPDGRWSVNNRIPGRNGRTLRKLAHAAADLLAPGGLLMYATCSLEPLENEKVLEKLLNERDDLETVADSQNRWQRQWLPGENDSVAGDGFFAARLRKK